MQIKADIGFRFEHYLREFVSKFQMNCITMFYIINNSHSDRQIHFILKLELIQPKRMFK